MNGSKNLVVVTNILAPYRIPLYKALKNYCDKLTVVYTGQEDNRKWNAQADNDTEFVKCRGMVIPYWSSGYGNRKFDRKYMHFPIGLTSLLKKIDPNRILSSEMGLRSMICLRYAERCNIPMVIHWGGTKYTELGTPLIKRIIRKIFVNKVNKWASYGISSSSYLKSIGIQKKNIIDVFNPIEENYEAGGDNIDIFKGVQKPIMLYVGRFAKLKGLDLLIECMGEMVKSGKVFSLVMVGSGPEEENLKLQAANNGLKNILFIPFQERHRLVSYYKSSDFLVFPSLQDVWGLVVNEALACGLPVLCSKYAGVVDNLVPPQWIFDPLEKESFKAGMEKAIEVGRSSINDFDVTDKLKGVKFTAYQINHIFDLLDK